MTPTLAVLDLSLATTSPFKSAAPGGRSGETVVSACINCFLVSYPIFCAYLIAYSADESAVDL